MDPYHRYDKFGNSMDDYRAKVQMAWNKLKRSCDVPKHYSIANVRIEQMVNQYYSVTFTFVCEEGAV